MVHLHVHSEYSLLDGACKISELPKRAKELGQKAIAITDHGVMYGVIDFYKACKQEGIKPIIGCECYVASRLRLNKVHGIDSTRHHIVLLCKNEIGYRNLTAMVSESWLNGFYTKPRIDKDLLQKHHEGLICLSGCLAGEIAMMLVRGDYNGAKEVASWYKSVFGEDYYLEMQNQGYSQQPSINADIFSLSKELGIPFVATNDVHYLKKSDSQMQEILLCIGTNHVLGEDTGMSFQTEEFYLKSEAEMFDMFSAFPDAVLNTDKIAEKCNLDFEFGNTVLPHFDVPNGEDHFVYFKNRCMLSLAEKFGGIPPAEYTQRLNTELDVINKMGYVDYFLIVADFIEYAKSKGIPVGPGRGSGAGSLCAYCMGITDIDPIKYKLIFERFLNPERVSMPDFDVDFCYVRRQEVIDYVSKKYGADHVSQIVTFGTLAAKAAIRDVGRVMGMPYALVDSVAKHVPNTLHITIEEALNESPEMMEMYKKDSSVHALVDMAKKVEGMPRHASTHAAGVVITREPVSTYVPLALNDDSPVTQFGAVTLEQLGLLKMDFLGLRTLTVIDDTIKMIKQREPDFDLNKISLSDKATFDMLSAGKTDAVFQLEGEGMRRVLSRLKPRSIEDLTAVLSLYRPGPANSIDTYINGKHHPETVKYKTPLLKSILDVTYGCMVYQEQVMQICRTVAGYSYGRADLVRRAMAKKKTDVMEKERRNFVYGINDADEGTAIPGAIANGVDEQTANEIFDEMSNFAKYAFNKSHACAYAHVSYQTAYLKCHYPAMFLAAMMTSVMSNPQKMSAYISDAETYGIKVLSPSVNICSASFIADADNIRFGLGAIKGVGSGIITTIENAVLIGGKFKSFYDFCSRCYGREFRLHTVESLIKSGACDGLGLNRRQMLMVLPRIIDSLNAERSRNISGQIGLFDMGSGFSQAENFEDVAEVAEFELNDLLAAEKDVTGLYLTCHPMAEYSYIYKAIRADKIADMTTAEPGESRYKDEDKVKIFGMVQDVEKRETKSGKLMYRVKIEDMTDSITCLVFSSLIQKKSQHLFVGNAIILEGTLRLEDGREPIILANEIEPNPKNRIPKPQNKKYTGVFVRLTPENKNNLSKLKTLLCVFPGDDELYVYIPEKNEYRLEGKGRMFDERIIEYLKLLFGDNNIAIKR